MGHWYLPDGTAWHFQPDGKATTLRHARKENAVPSVTTILGILDKPALTNWKLKQLSGACFSSITGEDLIPECPKEYHKEMMSRAFQDSTDQRDRGSEIHDCLEKIFLNEAGSWPQDIAEIAREAATAIKAYTSCDSFIPEQTVVGDGYGGMVDLHNDDFVIDWKTKDGVAAGGKLHWPEMAMQLAAYDQALPVSSEAAPWPVDLQRKQRRCINVFIDRQIPGDAVIHEWKPEEIELAWEKFQLLRDFWQLDKNYFPGAE